MKYSYRSEAARPPGFDRRMERKDPYLPSFEQRFGNAKRKRSVGLMEVPVSMIEGTFSNARRESFAPNFMPLLDENTEFGSKWARLLTVQEEEGFTDPIIVYEFNHRFYVAEGNKRTSVMKYQKVPVIPAEVVRILPNRGEMAELHLYEEFLEFFKVAPSTTSTSPHRNYRTLARVLERTSTISGASTKSSLRSEYRLFKSSISSVSDRNDITCSDAFLEYAGHLWSRGAGVPESLQDEAPDEADRPPDEISKKIEFSSRRQRRYAFVERGRGNATGPRPPVLRRPGPRLSAIPRNSGQLPAVLYSRQPRQRLRRAAARKCICIKTGSRRSVACVLRSRRMPLRYTAAPTSIMRRRCKRLRSPTETAGGGSTSF